ncbi:MAG: hypothetical protein ACREPZ_08965 [Rhodanobacteraceae bacterium]
MVPGERGMGVKSAKGLTIAVSMALLVTLLGGCGPEPPAPSPTSTWQLGNFGCAPIIYPEGYMKNQPVFVNEKVAKVGNDYNAEILLDRFKRDKCDWSLVVMGIHFMHQGNVYATYGFRPSETAIQTITCMPSITAGFGVCVSRKLNPREQQIKHKFHATVEYLP